MIYFDKLYQEAKIDIEVSFDLNVSNFLHLDKLKEEIVLSILSKSRFNKNIYLTTTIDNLLKEFVAQYDFYLNDFYLTKDRVKIMRFTLHTDFKESVPIDYSANFEVVNDKLVKFNLMHACNLGYDYLYNESQFHSDVLNVFRSAFDIYSQLNNRISITKIDSKFEDIESIEKRVLTNNKID